MNFNVKVMFFSLFFLCLQMDLTAQIEDHYHSFSGNIYIPIIVDHQEVTKYNDGRNIEKNIPNKEITISVHLKSETMRVKNGVFSGIIISNIGATMDEVISYSGEVSKDKQTIKFIEIAKESVTYVLDTREDVEKTITLYARFEDIPKSPYGSDYKFKYGVSKIGSVRYNEEYTIPRYGYVNSYTETFAGIDKEKIDAYYSGVRADFKPGDLIPFLQDESTIKLVYESNVNEDAIIDNVVKVFANQIISELLQMPDITVIEGLKVQKLIDEIELSQSGLVDSKTAVHAGREITPNIEIIVNHENRIPEDINTPVESFSMRSKFRIVATGQIVDPYFIFEFGTRKGTEFVDEHARYSHKVALFAVQLLYE
jgi:hypothetical protein